MVNGMPMKKPCKCRAGPHDLFLQPYHVVPHQRILLQLVYKYYNALTPVAMEIDFVRLINWRVNIHHVLSVPPSVIYIICINLHNNNITILHRSPARPPEPTLWECKYHSVK